MRRARTCRQFIVALGSLLNVAAAPATDATVGMSPWGADDDIGTLNMMTDDSRRAILGRIASGRVYDLSVEYFVGMPSWSAAGDPHYQFFMTHTPHGNEIDNPLGIPEEVNKTIAYTGDAVSMYTHMGTHIDTLNHIGLQGKIWNGYTPAQHLGDRGWLKTGAEKIPPLVARGVLIDVAAAKGMDELPDSYPIRSPDLIAALSAQGTELRPGDVVLVRTGRMRHFQDRERFMTAPPGMTVEACRWLVEEKKVMTMGADNLSFEVFPSVKEESEADWVPVHTYLLAEKGVPFMEVVYLEELARDRIYEFAFIAGSLKFRGASGAPLRPIAIPTTTDQ
jgi:kynurenine formamidase